MYLSQTAITADILSGLARNFLQEVRQSVASLPIDPCSAAVPSRPYNQNVMTCQQLHVTGHWPQ